MTSALDRAADLVRRADGLVVAAGAGMGVDSGLPDFRGTQGFWRAYPALAEAGIAFESIASPRAFRAQPDLAWGFYGHRLALYRDTVPHPGFAILRKWAQLMPRGSFVYTSNVDGQFQLAGFPPEAVYECHGSIHHLQCLARCTGEIWSAANFVPQVDAVSCRLRNSLPLCPNCGRLARPNILMFDDGEWLATRAQEQASRLESWLRDVRFVAVVELGAGTTIPTVRNFGERLVRAGRAGLIRINPREPQVPSSNEVSLGLGALQALREIDARLEF